MSHTQLETQASIPHEFRGVSWAPHWHKSVTEMLLCEEEYVAWVERDSDDYVDSYID